MNKLKILSWNVNSIYFKLIDCQHFMLENNVDVAMFQETKQNTVDKIEISGYKKFEVQPKIGSCGKAYQGLITFVKNNIGARLCNPVCMGALSQTLTIALINKGKECIRLTNVYIPQQELDTEDIGKLDNKKIHIISGDFKARHPNLSVAARAKKPDNLNGRKLHKFLKNSKTTTLISPIEPTFFYSRIYN